MAGNKFLQQAASGVGFQEKNSVQSSADTPVAGDIVALATVGGSPKIHSDLLNAVNASAGAGDAGKVILLDAGGRIDETFFPAGISETGMLVASEALAAGDWINVWNDTGTTKMRKADGTAAGKPADGFVRAAVASGASGKAYFEGINDQLTGLTGGAVWLSTSVAGGSQQTVPTGSGKVSQFVGTAISATSVRFEAQSPVTLA